MEFGLPFPTNLGSAGLEALVPTGELLPSGSAVMGSVELEAMAATWLLWGLHEPAELQQKRGSNASWVTELTRITVRARMLPPGGRMFATEGPR